MPIPLSFATRFATATLVALLAAPNLARANDTTAQLAAGGLKFVANADVEMRSEDLFISMEQVRVKYLFRNTSDKDVTVLVAFPMPDITLSLAQGFVIPFENEVNFLHFKTLVAGKPVETQIEQRAIAGDIDRTALLRELNIPLSPQLEATKAALDALPKEKQAQLIALGMGIAEEYDAGKGMERHLFPTWTLKTTYYWMQTFPAKADLPVEHSYTPSVGASIGTIIGMKSQDAGFTALQKAEMARYCVEPSFEKAVAGTIKPPRETAPFSQRMISYILITGANWSGPIGDFKLTIDKGAPKNLISFCADGVKKVSPTQFQVQAKDFYPQKNLDILILVPEAGQ